MRTAHLLVMRLATVFVAGAVLVPGNLLYAQNTTLAVVDFEAIGISQTESVALSNRLRNEFFRLGTFKVVDRGLMETILREQDIQQTGCTSNECLVEVGKLLGVQQMVGGSISRVGSILSVSARLVDVETGEVLNVSDYDLVGGLEEMLTEGMYEVALAISSREDVSMTTVEQPTPQPDQQVADWREMTAVEQPTLEPDLKVAELNFFAQRNLRKYRIGSSINNINNIVTRKGDLYFGGFISYTPYFTFFYSDRISVELIISPNSHESRGDGYGYYLGWPGAEWYEWTVATNHAYVRMNPQLLTSYYLNHGGFLGLALSVGIYRYSFSSNVKIESTRPDLQDPPSYSYEKKAFLPIAGIGIDLFGNHKIQLSTGIKYYWGGEEQITKVGGLGAEGIPEFEEDVLAFDFVQWSVSVSYNFNSSKRRNNHE